MKRAVRGQVSLAFIVGLALILGSMGATRLTVHAQGTPVADTAVPGSLPDMLGYLPNLPLEQEGVTIAYMNIALQAAATGIKRTSGPPPDRTQPEWVNAVLDIYVPSSLPEWRSDEWIESAGFTMYQVNQAVEYVAPPGYLLVVRGTFSPNAVRETWKRAGYQPIDLDGGEAYAIRDDFAMDLEDAASRRLLARVNVVALAGNGLLIVGSDRGSVAGALAAIDGTGPSMLDRPDIAPLAETAPVNLSAAYILPGTFVQYTPAAAIVGQTDEPLEDVATRVAEEHAAARQMPPVGSVLLGLTAGHAPDKEGDVAAQSIVALSVGSAAAAERGAAVVAARLDTEGVPSSPRSSVAGRPWAELYPDRTVIAVPDAGVVLATLTPVPGTRAAPLAFLAFARALTFVLW